MNLYLMMQMAFANLLHAKLRTMLAMLGILVGTASVVAMVSSGQLATHEALAQFKSLGTDLLAVSLFERNPETQKSQGRATEELDVNTILKLKSSIPGIREIAPYTALFANLSFNGKQMEAGVIGATAELQNTIKISMTQGRFISFLDHNRHYCILGNRLYQNYFKNINAIGKQIRMGENYFTIMGVADVWPENAFFNQDVNNSILIPLDTALLLNKSAHINYMAMVLEKDVPIDPLESKIKNYLQQKNPNTDVFFRSAKELIVSMEKQQDILTIFLGLIGSISLLVGGIGVMNIMLVSVTERRREIGIRRALGARQYDIQIMFLVEAIMLAISGGFCGITIGILTSFVIAKYAHWQFQLFLLPPMIGFTVSVFVGIFFGFYPAYQAARLDPINALRAE